MAGDAVDRDAVAEAAGRVLARDRHILGGAARERLLEAVADAALGLGPLERLMRDPAVTEIMVCRHDRVFVERDGRVEPAEAGFADAAHVLHVVDRILAPLGRRVDESSPMVDARLPDGSRVNVVIPPLAVDGPAVTIRRFGARPLTARDLVDRGTLTSEVLGLLECTVAARRNILVTGGTGSGKTTTLAALAGAIPAGERVVTIEDAAELRLPLPHVVRLESRPASLEGRGAVPIRALVRNALRMRPDRIVVGEVRGGEALDMLSAMTTGHEGSLSTLHASSPGDALRRLQLLALMGDLELPWQAVAEQVAAAIDLVVHQARLPDGRRRVLEVCALRRGAGGGETLPLARLHDDRLALTGAAEAWRRDLARPRDGGA
ncbi:MAG: CpaF family protein [Thermoleophilia bacterium]|nr:CpaF family protein [Thermoleophilia bacterium]